MYRKKRKVWLIYAYDRATNEIVAYVWGKRDFKPDEKQISKRHTVGIEGNNCRLRHRLRRAVRKTCCFSKKLDNHFKTSDLVFFYINYGYV